MPDHSAEQNLHRFPETTQLRQPIEQALARELRSAEGIPEADRTLGVIEGMREQASLRSDVPHAAVEHEMRQGLSPPPRT